MGKPLNCALYPGKHMEPKVDGSHATLEVVGNHWLIDRSHQLDCNVIATAYPPRLKGSSCEVKSLFVGVTQEKPVKDFFQSLKNCDLVMTAPSDIGLYAVIECKGSHSLEYRASRFQGRIGMSANPRNKKLRLTVDSPFNLNASWFVDLFEGLSEMKMEKGLALQKTKIPLSDFIEFESHLEELDEKDGLIAKELLKSGFYSVPRPEGLTLESLGEKVKLSKPALITRIRRLESLGIKKLLVSEEITEEDQEAAYSAFQAALDK